MTRDLKVCCPRCGSEEVRGVRRFGRKFNNEMWCTDCGRRWNPECPIFAPDDDACTHCTHCGLPLEQHDQPVGSGGQTDGGAQAMDDSDEEWIGS
jgi:transcription elongation factor Elf1